MLAQLTGDLQQGRDLDPDRIPPAVEALASPGASPEEKAGFLAALARKGETVAEIAGFARVLREKSVPVPLPEELRRRDLLDVCGTGGDGQNTFNISTTVAIVAAAAGVPVAKHGNRAITSRSGSADVLEALGVPIEEDPARCAAGLEEHGFAFFFAPRYHPAFRHIAPARKLCASRGQRTIFNFLGPLLNPARPTAQLVGVPDPSLCAPLARTLQSLGLRRGMVVCGRCGDGHMDELSVLGPTSLAEFYQDRGFSEGELDPAHLSLPPLRKEDLEGGDARENARMVRDILEGRERAGRRSAVLLNAGAALFVAGRCASVTEGWDRAAQVIDEGLAARKLEDLARS